MGSISATPDVSFGTAAHAPSASDPAVTRRPVSPAQDETDLRLIIEEGQSAGSYVYKTINRVTGEVVAQFPRESLLHLRDQAEYEVGAVISAKA